MLEKLGFSSVDELIEKTVPKEIVREQGYWEEKTETQALAKLEAMMEKNVVLKNFIGQGYYGTHTPLVILRNILQNPAWYTAYTPYQAEISQGRLEMLLNFQTMVCDITGMEVANASLLDEATAAAEAMSMSYAISNHKKPKFFVSENIFPQSLEVIKTRAGHMGVEVVIGDIMKTEMQKGEYCGVLVQYPDNKGRVIDAKFAAKKTHDAGAMFIMGTDLMANTLLKSPGEYGADIVYVNSQRFGVPMGYGGPHAAFFATKTKHMRKMPGRIIGVSKDKMGNQALRMALQTREQHIRRDRASSNICTAQALLANVAASYAIYHGPNGLRDIAHRINSFASLTRNHLKELGYTVEAFPIFDTVTLYDVQASSLAAEFAEKGINIRQIDESTVSVSFDETHMVEDVQNLIETFAAHKGKTANPDLFQEYAQMQNTLPKNVQRGTELLSHPIFNEIHSEHQMLRYLYRLQNKDISLCNSMISLGSCTMKLNATCEMVPISWEKVANMHPYTPMDQAQGYREMILDLEDKLKMVTDYYDISFQPNSGAQGEYAGLLAINEYQKGIGQEHRNICLIPVSAHGTNPASAVMAGLKVVTVNCDEEGDIDIEDLTAKAQEHASNLSCFMITYPSTHGVFESRVQEYCDIIHNNGGQVYMDGANMNAQVGITAPGFIGADVCHLNLHKTFSIPHGGGGPGMGPIGVKEHLSPYLPSSCHYERPGGKIMGQLSSTQWGSASILPISWMYCQTLGSKGVTEATKHAILNANYIAGRLNGHFDVLYKGENGTNAHEMIIDFRSIKAGCGISEEDVAKRLMDFGFHAPTMSWPVVGTLMIEPTESEDQGELDRFCDALIKIREEIRQVEEGTIDAHNNPLKNAPHTLQAITGEWDHPYTREEAAYPLPWIAPRGKFWPTVSRIDNVYGDKNLCCLSPDWDLYV